MTAEAAAKPCDGAQAASAARFVPPPAASVARDLAPVLVLADAPDRRPQSRRSCRSRGRLSLCESVPRRLDRRAGPKSPDAGRDHRRRHFGLGQRRDGGDHDRSRKAAATLAGQRQSRRTRPSPRSNFRSIPSGSDRFCAGSFCRRARARAFSTPTAISCSIRVPSRAGSIRPDPNCRIPSRPSKVSLKKL